MANITVTKKPIIGNEEGVLREDNNLPGRKSSDPNCLVGGKKES